MLLHTCRLVFLLALFALTGCETTPKPSPVTIVPYELEGFDWHVYAARHGCYIPEKDSPDVVVSPKVLFQPLSAYPFMLKRYGVEGIVSFACVIDEQGRVADVTIYESTHIGFHESTLQTIYKSKFTPGTVNGVPRKFSIRSALTFSLPK